MKRIKSAEAGLANTVKAKTAILLKNAVYAIITDDFK